MPVLADLPIIHQMDSRNAPVVKHGHFLLPSPMVWCGRRVGRPAHPAGRTTFRALRHPDADAKNGVPTCQYWRNMRDGPRGRVKKSGAERLRFSCYLYISLIGNASEHDAASTPDLSYLLVSLFQPLNELVS